MTDRPIRRCDLESLLRFALVGLVALALAFQGYLAGAHDHAPVTRSHVSAAHASNGFEAHHNDGPSDQTPESCPICQSIALAWALLPVADVRLIEPLRFAAWYDLPGHWLALPRQWSHAWHSRGPPAG
ncbi:DUF2946 family protein [Sphingomonas sp. GB1N7]|uniref:DUF2946 family protein n=1 Tax=Parasphingomonas caseinilytica TaxID=3096158 RepID=UPI002FC8357D